MLVQDGFFLPFRHIAEKFHTDLIARRATGRVTKGIILPLGQVEFMEPIPVVRAEILRDGEGHHTADGIFAISQNDDTALPAVLPIFVTLFLHFFGVALGKLEIQFPGSNTGRPLDTGHFFQRRFLLLWIQCASRQNHKAQRNAEDAHPDLRLLPFCHIQHPALGVTLAEGKGHPGHHALVGGQPQKRLGIIRPDVLPQPLDDGFITAHFHVLPGKAKGQPHQRIEPVQA